MIVQIMPESDLSYGFIRFMRENINEEFRYILIKGNKTYEPINLESVLLLDNRFELVVNTQAKKWLKSCDAIILNWVDGLILSLLFSKRKKIAVMFWGGDLVSFLKGLSSKSFIERSINFCVKKQIEHLPCVITLTRGEYEKLKLACKLRGKWFLGSFMTNSMKEIGKMHSRREEFKEVRILLGNSATLNNRHEQLFDILKKFKDTNSVFYCPLTYGDSNYRDKLIKLGKSIFGEKFIPLVDHMDSSTYLDFLSTISVGVFNHDRQQGMGNISRLLAFGAKVYLSEDGPLLKENLKDGLIVFPTESIKNLSFGEFVYMSDDDRINNIRSASFESYSTEAINLWGKIISFLNTVMRNG